MSARDQFRSSFCSQALVILFCLLVTEVSWAKLNCHRYQPEKIQTWQRRSGFAEKDLTQWTLNSQPQFVAFVFHGLNLQPSAMSTLANSLTAKGGLVLRASLMGHSGDPKFFKQVSFMKWHIDFVEAYCVARNQADDLKLPLVFAGYSLGSIIGLEAKARLPQLRWDRQILLAPPVEVTTMSKMIQGLFWWESFTVPSMGNKKYRAHSYTPMRAYIALFDAIEAVQEKPAPKAWNLPTLVVMDNEDELVSYDGVKNFIKKHRLSQWDWLDVKVLDSSLKTSGAPHHGVFGDAYMGQERWAGVEKVMGHFLNGTTQL